MKKLAVLLLVFLFTSCEKEAPVTATPEVPAPEHPFWSTFQPWKVSYGTFSMPYATNYASFPDSLGTVSIQEASGIAASRKNPGKIWAHNDSGFPNHLFLIDTSTASIVATYVITGATNIDWEDMEIVADPLTGVPFVYIANTGDNRQNRNDYDIFRFEEPEFQATDLGQQIVLPTNIVSRHRFRYPERSHDVEALFVDPANLDVYLITKRDASSIVYVMPFPYQSGAAFNKTYKVGELGFKEASAATASFDGNKIIIKTRQDIFYWERTAALEPYHMLLSQTPVRLPYVGEPQGEAVCFDAADNYFTLSEALNLTTPPTLFRYRIQ
jgi:hypothetical protein